MKINANPLCGVLDRIVEYQVKRDAGFRCEICGEGNNGLERAHIISRRYLSTRWDKRNLLAVCQGGCHDYATIIDWLLRTDSKRHQWIIEQKRRIVSHREIDLSAIHQRLLMEL